LTGDAWRARGIGVSPAAPFEGVTPAAAFEGVTPAAVDAWRAISPVPVCARFSLYTGITTVFASSAGSSGRTAVAASELGAGLGVKVGTGACSVSLVGPTSAGWFSRVLILPGGL
jgi:hypothetical protein